MLLLSGLKNGGHPLSAAQRVQPEGRVHEMGLGEKLLYLWKYFVDQNTHAAPEWRAHFDAQRALAAYGRSAEPANGVRLGFVGDLMWIRNDWQRFLPAATLAELRKLDGLVGNLETVVSPNFPVRELWPDLLDFNSRPELVRAFRRENGESLFAALSFANNHTLDFGDPGVRDTLAFLKEEQIPRAGVRLAPGEKRWAEFTRGGLRFGFYAATFGVNDRRRHEASRVFLETMPGLHPDRAENVPNLEPAREALAEMHAAGIDVKLVYLHWGHEFDFYPSRRQRTVARELVLAGADVVAGTHSHVPQPDETFFINGHEKTLPAHLLAALPKDSFLSVPGCRPRRAQVLYGLGNFTTAMYTFPCRLARLAELSFSRSEHGGEISFPRTRFLLNEAPAGGRPRSLRFYESRDAEFLLLQEHVAGAASQQSV